MKRSGAIWPMFSRDLHMVDRREPDKAATIFGSIDFGFAVGHETAVLWHEVSSNGVYTFDGFEACQKGIKEINELMRAQTNGLIVAGIFPDPARPDLIDELQREGWPILETNKDVEMGIAKVGEYMQFDPINKKPKWTMANHLTRACEEIEQYVWTEVPKKELDNFCDSLRYMINSYYNKPREPERKKSILNPHLVLDPYR
jgi:hypothetical protein